MTTGRSFRTVDLPESKWHRCETCNGTGDVIEVGDAHRSAGLAPCPNCKDGIIRTRRVYSDVTAEDLVEVLAQQKEPHPQFGVHGQVYVLSQDPMARARVLHDLNGKEVYIFSCEHNAYWRPNRSGYSTDKRGAGIYPFAEAWAATSHCGPEKQIHYIVYNREATVDSIPDERLVWRAVCNAHPTRRKARWVIVMEHFGLGATYAQQLCRRFGMDPFEVKK